MNIKFGLGRLALVVAICSSNMVAIAQTQPAQPAANIPATPTAGAGAPAPASKDTTPPGAQSAPASNSPAPPGAVSTPTETPAPPATDPAKVVTAAKPPLSRCTLAIRAAERKLEKSTASPDKVASAWQHIREAKNSRGKVCEAHAREASDQL